MSELFIPPKLPLPEGWRFCSLESICTGIFDCPHSTPKLTNSGPFVIRTQDIITGVLDLENAAHVSEDTYIARVKRAEPMAGDILYSREGTYFGIAAEIPKGVRVCLGQRMVLIRPQKDVNSSFLRYWLNSSLMASYIEGFRDGSVAERLNMSTIRMLPIGLPDIETQNAIARVICSLEDKIALLHRQNKTLEAIAATLFRQCFIEEAQEDWEEKTLSETTTISIGRTPPRKEFHWFSTNSSNVKWVSIKDLGQSGVFVFDTSEYLTKEAVEKFKIPIIPIDTVLLSFKMTIGRVGITTEPMLSNEAIAHFKFNEGTPFSKEYLYLWLKNFRYDSLGSTSSIVTSINSSMIKDMEIAVPDNATMKSFQSKVEPLFNKIKQNQMQIRTLERLCDTLLPKLMSGEVQVEYKD